MLGLKMGMMKVFSMNYLRGILSSSVGDWGINSSRIRLRRDDDDFEKEFNSVAGELDVAGITEFNSWNMLDGGAYRDYLYDVPLGVDSDNDGVSDNWDLNNATPSNITISRSIDEGAQRIDMTSSTNASDRAGIEKRTIEVEPLTTYTLRTNVKVLQTTGSFTLRILVYFSGTLASELYTNSEFEEKINTFTTKAGQTTVEIFYQAYAVAGGDTGTVWVKDAILVKNDFIENIGLLTVDDGGDGVANEWTYSTNGFNGTVVNSVSDDGQKMEITVGGSNTNEPFINFTKGDNTSGYVYVGTVDVRVSGDVKGYLKLTEELVASSDSSVVDSSEWVTVSASRTFISSNDLTFKIRLVPNAVGSTGYVEYRNATLKQTNNSTFVSKIFDKSGNGNHAIQTTASEQPRLIDAGTFEVDGDGNYAMYLDGVDDHFDITDSTGLNLVTNLSILTQHNPTANTGYVLTRNSDTSLTVQFGVFVTNSGITNSTQAYLEGDQRAGDLLTTLNQSRLNIMTYDKINVKMFLDGVLKDTTSFSTTLTSRNNIQIGCRSSSTDGSTKAVFYTGYISRIIIFNKALTQQQVTYLSSSV